MWMVIDHSCEGVEQVAHVLCLGVFIQYHVWYAVVLTTFDVVGSWWAGFCKCIVPLLVPSSCWWCAVEHDVVCMELFCTTASLVLSCWGCCTLLLLTRCISECCVVQHRSWCCVVEVVTSCCCGLVVVLNVLWYHIVPNVMLLMLSHLLLWTRCSSGGCVLQHHSWCGVDAYILLWWAGFCVKIYHNFIPGVVLLWL
jgi:hypothetical protein